MRSSEKQARRKFPPEFKSQAVKRVLSGHKVAAVAKALGIGVIKPTDHYISSRNGLLAL